MTRDVPLMQQTVYAELLDRCMAAAFDDAFPENGTFVAKEVRGHRYWYFQEAAVKKQRYVGPETPELLDRVSHHRQRRDSERERRVLVSTLVRSAHLPRPLPALGDALAALAAAGVFRLRGVLVGTLAFQAYSASLGVRLPRSAIETMDVDIAQDRNVSVAVKDSVEGLLNSLQKADSSFRPVPPRPGSEGTSSYTTAIGDIRVEFLTPDRGRDSDAAVLLPALDTYAQQLRFLDYLIRDPEPAVVLHGPGILVQIPAPERYCLHKLIVARHRSATSAKIGKDLQQAETLLAVLTQRRPHELREAWDEAVGHGVKWRRLLLEGLGQIEARVRDEALRTFNLARGAIPDLDITLSSRGTSYHPPSDTLKASAVSKDKLIACVVEGDAMTRLSGQTVDPIQDRIGAIRSRTRAFEMHFRTIERAVRSKYLQGPIESPDTLRITGADIESRRTKP